MPHLAHRIRQLRWQVSTHSAEDAFAIRQTLAQQWQESFLPAMAQVFDEAAPEETIVHIPKLELQLTVDAAQPWMEQLPALIQQQLREQLQSLGSSLATGTQPAQRDAPPPAWQIRSVAHQEVDRLLHYLRTGSLPWHTSHLTATETALALQQTCQQQWQPLLDYLRDIPEPAAFYFRLLQLLPHSDWLRLVNAVSESLPETWRDAVMQMMTVVLEPDQPWFDAYQQPQGVAAFLAESQRCRDSDRPPDGMALLQRMFMATDDQSLQTRIPGLIAALPASAALLLGLDLPCDRHADAPDPLAPYEPSPETSPVEASPTKSSPRLGNDRTRHQVSGSEIPLIDDRPTLPLPEIQFPPLETTDNPFPLSVSYAGLVLIHPFLGRCLEAVGIKPADQKTLNPASLPRAAALLHFLATGSTAIYEYELGLIKLLLGLEPTTPLLVTEGLLQPDDQDEAETLLRSVIEYWPVLKNTSVAGLRASFLQRSGLLRPTETGWQLQVEPQAFDMLLNHLPWAIGLIKFSWMPKPLCSEWIIP